jgi:DNA polymerase-3 subunit epsilon
LLAQRCIPHEPEAMKLTVRELLRLAASLGAPPRIVDKAEVDQINIISRWIHHHSHDRAFFPFQQALTDEDEARLLAQRIWVEADAVRNLQIDDSTEEEDNTL